jgi:L-ascorbate metabolism protein UlaG (beta-lactamase superfamily)
MKIKWYAHAAVLFADNQLRIIADPYSPTELGFATITEPADIVIRSSADDLGHCYAEMISGDPIIVTATELEPEGVTVRGIHFTPIHARESLIHKERPRDNAMYRFTLDGIRIAHLGDVGNRLTDDQLDGLHDVDVLLAPVGGPPTIDLDDLVSALNVLQPRLVIPLHYRLPSALPKMLPVQEFTNRFAPAQVIWNDSSEIELTQTTLPATMQILVLKPSTAPAPEISAVRDRS